MVFGAIVSGIFFKFLFQFLKPNPLKLMVPKENIFPVDSFKKFPRSLLLTALIDQMQQVLRDKEDFAKESPFQYWVGVGGRGGALGRQKHN